MENEQNLDGIINNMMDKMRLFAGEVPKDDFMTYLFKVQDIMEYYDEFLNSDSDEEMEKISNRIMAKIASYYN